MGFTIPTTEPTELNVGDTWQWNITLSDFPATAWTLKYNLISSDASAINILITSTADGVVHVIDEETATTAAFTAGDYKLEKYVIDIGDTLRYSLGVSSLTVNPDPSSDTDARSHVKKVLDAIETNIEGLASKEQQSYSIAGRSLSRYSPEELVNLRDKYQALYQQELQDERIANGENSGRTVKVRFT
jgi:hypothetical protein